MKQIIYTVTFLLSTINLQAQDKTAAAKQKIKEHLLWIQQLQSGNRDSLVLENKKLLLYLDQSGKTIPALLTTDLFAFKALGLELLNADDNKLRIYQWKTGLRDTMKGVRTEDAPRYTEKYNAVAQFSTGQGTGSLVLQNSIISGGSPLKNFRYDSLITINASDGGAYYLPVSSGIDEMGNKSMNIEAYLVDGSSFIHANIFTDGKAEVNNVSISYSSRSPEPGRMKWDAVGKTLLISSPGRRPPMIYKFDDHKFVSQPMR
jgi:hypothetical protein